LIEALQAAASDPDGALVGWIRDGVPLGIAKDIETCGIFPLAEDPSAEWEGEVPVLGEEELSHFLNHGWERTDTSDFVREFSRLCDLGYAVRLHGSEAFDRGFINKMAAVIKTREDGSKKVRLITDMLRSGANLRVRLPERLILPRATEVVENALAKLRAFSPGEGDEASDRRVELATADISDAFPHLCVAEEELKHCLVVEPLAEGSQATGGERLAVLPRLCFGAKSAPLIWSRLAALLGRVSQGCLGPGGARIVIYLDDPLFVLSGTRIQRDKDLACVLGLWIALGLKISWGKASRGTRVKWIGVQFDVDGPGKTIQVQVPANVIAELASEVEQLLGAGRVAVRRLRRLAGRLAWAGGVVPRMRWASAPLWGIIAAAERAIKTQHGERQPRDNDRGGPHSAHLVSLGVARPALGWLLTMWKRQQGAMTRVYRAVGVPSRVVMTLDASPWGIGGVLTHKASNIALAYFTDKLSQVDTDRFLWDVGDPAGQCTWEALAVLVGLRLWGAVIGGQGSVMEVMSDNMAAVVLSTRMCSSSARLNCIGAELALTLEEMGIQEMQAVHLPGSLNVTADFLSRLDAPGGSTKAWPDELAGAKRKRVPLRDDAFFPCWGAAGGHGFVDMRQSGRPGVGHVTAVTPEEGGHGQGSEPA
jgi:hypothetical protein